MNPATNGERSPLRIALLLDSFNQRSWVRKIIEDIESSSIAKVVLVVRNAAELPHERRFVTYWRNRRHLLYALYSRIDNGRVKIEPDAFALDDVRSLIPASPIIDVSPQMTKHTDSFSDSDIARLRDYKIDVALAFGFRILKGEILKVTKFGVWSYHHGDNLVNRGGPAGFWEVMDGHGVTGSILQVLTEDLDNGKVIYRSWSPTADQFSVKANRNNLYWKSSTFVMRKLHDVYNDSGLQFEQELYRPYSAPLYKIPANNKLAAKLLRLTCRYVASKLEHATHAYQWALAYRFRTGPADTNNSFYRFKYLQPANDRFWADPFPVNVDQRHYVFFEEYEYKAHKGHISVIELDHTGMVAAPVQALSMDYHLSYPFIFEWQGMYYMIPESAAHRTIELYRCTAFPFKWELHAVLMDGIRAQDTTLFEQDGVWWMFFCAAERCVPDELYVYFADTPLGPWKPHRLNPVKSDVRSSRPAGRLFYWNNELYRPAQDGSPRYGSAISLNRIRRLDTDHFCETEVSKILPAWRKDLRGTHTINTAGDLTVIDCLIKRRR
ncbi:MAG: hypothetical protein ABR555_07185 [Pyrinomonadaceae bacterium]